MKDFPSELASHTRENVCESHVSLHFSPPVLYLCAEFTEFSPLKKDSLPRGECFNERITLGVISLTSHKHDPQTTCDIHYTSTRTYKSRLVAVIAVAVVAVIVVVVAVSEHARMRDDQT